MRDNVRHFLQLLSQGLALPAPVLEIGAMQTEGQESYADMRPFFGEGRYVGCDMRPGQGVDCLADAHRLPFRDGSVGTALLLDTLEHVQSPLVATQEAARSVGEGGVVLLASVMNFPIHAFPSDYWRFTPAVFDYLLATLPNRFVCSQGDAEFPHTVIGVAMKASAREDEERFREAVRRLTQQWAEDAPGGPLLVWEPAVIVAGQRRADRALPKLEQGRTIAQSFVCPSDDLSRIDVKLSNLGRSNNCHVLFRLLEEDGRREIAACRLFAGHVTDEHWAFFPVPPQAGSAGRRYLLSLESPDAIMGDAVAAMASDETAYADGQLFVDGEPAEGSLCFQVYCRSSDGPVSEGARAESPDARRAQLDGPDANDLAALILRAEEQRWEQVRYLAATIRSGLDALQAEQRMATARMEARLESQAQLEVRLQMQLQALERLEKDILNQSTEAASLARAVKENPLYRAWKRRRG